MKTMQAEQALLSPFSPPDARPSTFHIASLDGIRGVAFLLVFFSHSGLKQIVPGGFGVTVFFVLSGFLITTLLRLEYQETGRIDLKAFYLRRTFRILPLFYLVLVSALILRVAGQLSGSLDAPAVVSQVFHFSNFYLIANGPDSVAGGTIVLWSLAIEEHFYLVFPLVYGLIRRRLSTRMQVILLCCACLGCLAWRLVLILGMGRPYVRAELGTDTRFDCLLAGAILAIAVNPALDMSRLLWQKRLNVIAPLSLVCLLFTFLYRNEDFRFTWRFTIQAFALLPLFAYAITSLGSLTFRLLNSRVMVQLGTLSYALYLVHAVILDWLSNHWDAKEPAVGATALAASLLVAKLLQITVERPIQKYRRKYSRILS
jgi:peptidoglycan/LPS O-acetylase OafA/YrhL